MNIKKTIALTLISLATSLPLFAQIYTVQEAFQDLASEPLTFVGRDYPNADLGPGGNYVCIYKNSRIYVRHEGCRPTAAQRLAVFSAKIISRNDGLVEVYIEHNRTDYRLEEAGPQMDGIWKLSSTDTEGFSGELTFGDLISKEKNEWNKNFNACVMSKSLIYPDQIPETKCYGDATDSQGSIEVVWREPFSHGVREAHDIIMKAPRK